MVRLAASEPELVVVIELASPINPEPVGSSSASIGGRSLRARQVRSTSIPRSIRLAARSFSSKSGATTLRWKRSAESSAPTAITATSACTPPDAYAGRQ